jgi:hypothetical protein
LNARLVAALAVTVPLAPTAVNTAAAIISPSAPVVILVLNFILLPPFNL